MRILIVGLVVGLMGCGPTWAPYKASSATGAKTPDALFSSAMQVFAEDSVTVISKDRGARVITTEWEQFKQFGSLNRLRWFVRVTDARQVIVTSQCQRQSSGDAWEKCGDRQPDDRAAKGDAIAQRIAAGG